MLLLDEFSIAVDPVTTMRIEDVLKELKEEMTIVLVTNLVQQARSVGGPNGLLPHRRVGRGRRDPGAVQGRSTADQRTKDYLEGRFG